MHPMTRHVKRRGYDNSRRRARSIEKRQRIIDAARELIVEHGYHFTTIADIARAADVHIDTVYQLVGRKPMVLRELVEQAISGVGTPVDAEQRDYVVAFRAETDPLRKLSIYAHATRSIHERLAPLLVAVRDGAVTETEVLDMWREISDRRAANMRRLVDDLRTAGGVRDDLSLDVAADTIWATNSTEMYIMLTVERGWTADDYEHWLVDIWSRFLLAATDPEPGA
jgi:AcrR family transcriptional regulator